MPIVLDWLFKLKQNTLHGSEFGNCVKGNSYLLLSWIVYLYKKKNLMKWVVSYTIFKFVDETMPVGFRGDYKITGLEWNTTYYVEVKGDWGTKIISSDKDTSFTTLSPGEKLLTNNPIEEIRDRISGNSTLQK